jgi:DNA polymerase-3 subunit epsilon
MEVEPPEIYNARVREAVDSFVEKGSSAALLGKGRTARERSVVLVEEGKYVGFGFLDRKASLDNFDEVKKLVKRGVETPTVQNLVNSYLQNPRGADLIVF